MYCAGKLVHQSREFFLPLHFLPNPNLTLGMIRWQEVTELPGTHRPLTGWFCKPCYCGLLCENGDVATIDNKMRGNRALPTSDYRQPGILWPAGKLWPKLQKGLASNIRWGGGFWLSNKVICLFVHWKNVVLLDVLKFQVLAVCTWTEPTLFVGQSIPSFNVSYPLLSQIRPNLGACMP